MRSGTSGGWIGGRDLEGSRSIDPQLAQRDHKGNRGKISGKFRWLAAIKKANWENSGEIDQFPVTSQRMWGGPRVTIVS